MLTGTQDFEGGVGQCCIEDLNFLVEDVLGYTTEENGTYVYEGNSYGIWATGNPSRNTFDVYGIADGESVTMTAEVRLSDEAANYGRDCIGNVSCTDGSTDYLGNPCSWFCNENQILMTRWIRGYIYTITDTDGWVLSASDGIYATNDNPTTGKPISITYTRDEARDLATS